VLTTPRAAVIALLCACSCSVIVDHKLGSKPSGDAGKASDGKPGEAAPGGITGERSKAGPFVIGEQITIPLAGVKGTPTLVVIGSAADKGVVCPGVVAGSAYVCTIGPFTHDGAQKYFLVDSSFRTIGSGSIAIRRLVIAGATNLSTSYLHDSETLEEVGSVPVGEFNQLLTEFPKLSPSGRYLLLLVKSGLELVDLVNRVTAAVPKECLTIEASDFEPELLQAKLRSDSQPVTFFAPENYLWCGTASGVATVRLPQPPKRIDGTLTAVVQGAFASKVKQLAWTVLPQGGKWLAGVVETPSRVFLRAPDGKVLTADVGGTDLVRVMPLELKANPLLGTVDIADAPVVLALTSGSSLLTVFGANAGKLDPLTSLTVKGGGSTLKVAAFVPSPYTAMAGLQIKADLVGSAKVPPHPIYVNIGMESDKPAIQQRDADPSGHALDTGRDLFALPVSHLANPDAPYVKRYLAIQTPTALAKGLISVEQDFPKVAQLCALEVPSLSLGAASVSAAHHPRLQRLYYLEGKKLSAWSYSPLQQVVARDLTSPAVPGLAVVFVQP